MRHHAFIIGARAEEGIERALEWLTQELKMSGRKNPDIVVLKYGLFSVEDARQVSEIAASGPVAEGAKAIIISASRAYREAQNALLKLFEEPPPGTYLFLVLPTLGSLLPTLKSRVQVLKLSVGSRQLDVAVLEFLKGSREKRSAIVKKLVSGKDEEERREHRDEAIAIVNGVEAVAHAELKKSGFTRPRIQLLEEVQVLRRHLYERSAPVRMILEHLAIVVPRDLV